MTDWKAEEYQRVLISSANPLFGKGLERLLRKRSSERQLEIRLAKTMEETMEVLENWRPDLVIVDYDDRTINRSQFLSVFVSDSRPMQVMLVSLQASGEIVVYDRRTLTPSEMEDWLNLPYQPETPSVKAQPVPLNHRSENMRHYVIVGFLTIISTILVNFWLTSINILPVNAANEASPIDRMFSVHIFLISFLFSLISMALLYSVIVFRKRREGPQEGLFIRGSSRLEVIWTIVPLGAVLYLSYLGSTTLADTRRVDPQAMVVNVTSGQWFWRFDYPDFGIQSDSLTLPVNKQVLLRLTSQDVIHSFWVPEFRVKQDALPGENLVRELRFTPNREGTYQVMCAEMCGGAHAYMTADVVVMDQAGFDAWVQQQGQTTAQDPAARGQALAQTTGCLGCHTTDGAQSVGPTWQGLFGETQTLSDGTEVIVDDQYLLESIIDPNDQVPEGFAPNIMPQNYEDTLSSEEINDLVEFIKSLQ